MEGYSVDGGRGSAVLEGGNVGWWVAYIRLSLYSNVV